MQQNEIEQKVMTVLRDVLAIGPSENLSRATALLGARPEVDSFFLVELITALENEVEIRVDDDELSASIFATVGSLVDFVEGKRTAREGADCNRSS